jgi:hypothetical protein
MTKPNANAPLVPTSNILPGETTPTWQMELLLSGGLVVLVFQLIGACDLWIARTGNQLSQQWLDTLGVTYLFLQAALSALFIAFCVHLILRCFWASMIGLRSVYPRGINWDQVARGPMTRNSLKEILPALDVAIERVDNAASLVFALGGLLMTFCLYFFAFGAAAVALINFLREVMPGLALINWLGLALFLGPFAPIMLSQLIDRYWGQRLDPQSKFGKWVNYFVGWGNKLVPRSLNTMLYTFTSNLGRVRGTVVFVGLTYIIIGIVTFRLVSAQHGSSIFRPAFLPALSAVGTAQSVHYLDMRKGTDRFSADPYVQSMRISGPYLALRIPFGVAKYTRAMALKCPEQLSATVIRALHKEPSVAAQLQPLQTCLNALHTLSLDQKIVAADFVLEQQQADEAMNLLMMLDVRALADGKHVLQIIQPRRIAKDEGKDAVATRLSEIIFWK